MKETRQQIIENTKKKISAQYAEQVRSLKETVKITNEKIWKLRGEISELKQEKSNLEMKIKEQQDWIERLQDFVNMPPEQREQELAVFRQKQANVEAERKLFNSPIFKMYETMLNQMLF